MQLKGLVGIVTGAGQGMGREFAFALAREGARVAICDIQIEAIEETARLVREQTSAQVLSRVVDVSEQDQVDRFTQAVLSEWGKVEILVNNAAIHPLHRIEEITSDEWDKVLAINLKSLFLFCRAILPAMRRQKFGRIINIASEAGKNGGTISGLHYAASKGGVLSFTRNLARQVGSDGITVNAIAPGRIATPMALKVSKEENQIFIDRSAVKRLGEAADIARTVVFLSSPAAGFITGETLNVNGGTLMD
ncbi:MAG TPA: SDR family oxidoreductase [Spirochaetia bacterium]|nr:SDR family oxidoreductase [Spirochaetia bacterium]